MNRLSILLLAALCSTSWSEAEELPEFSQEQLALFETRIRPVIVAHCYECHSTDSKIVHGGLRLDSRRGLLQGGESGPAVVPGKVEESLLIRALRHDGIEMPPKGRLADSVIRDFETWVKMGAPDPRETPDPKASRRIDIETGRQHWAFQPVADPATPKVHDEAWPVDPLDRYVLARLEQAGLRPAADADRYTWLRRVSLDLTGLPPTPAEMEAFVRDDSRQAPETVVDRLLQSRAFGERWARHWLDLTGYADMMGTSNNVFAEHAWRYRDYLIEALHKDKPFDRFVREQIAGDLLAAASPQERAENITATGFLMVGDVEIVEPDKAKMEADHIDTQVAKIGTAFLGMTLNCVRCHDHKFDPIALSDYYGLAGILRSSPSTHKIPFGVWSTLNSTALPETLEQLATRQKLEAEHAAKLAAMKEERTRLNADKTSVMEEIAQIERAEEATRTEGGSPTPSARAPRNAEQKLALTRRRDDLAEQTKKLNAAIQHAEFFSSKAPRAFAMHDGERPADMPIYIRGNPYSPGEVVPRGTIRVASWDKFPEIPAGQSGRLQLADWLADPHNPLTPRVAVNRIWQKLFGEGLVRSVDYFGTRGERPSHPELLDHLATRFMQNGWSQKQLIRSLVLSRTYRLSSVNNAEAMKVDPDNRLLSRMNRQRLDAEALRDQLLAVSGELRPSQGGPALVLEEVENCGALALKGVNPPSYTHRKPRAGEQFLRTIYLPVMRTDTATNDRLRSFFDFVNPAQVVGQRSQTVVPTQSLFVMNNDLFRQRAKALAEQLVTAAPQPEVRLTQLWLRVFNRPITTAERDDALTFLATLDATLGTEERAYRESVCWQELCHALLASNEFLFRI
ncbi:MAG: PSD1 and planctomycete cytochrome C domain-containing protein [Pirellulaceae bacterium]